MNADVTGFFSYSRFDDRHHSQMLSSIRSFIQDQVRSLLGVSTFELFQDVENLEPGDRWRRRLEEAVDRSSVCVPIVSPSFLRSEWCRREIEIFSNRAWKIDRDDLLIPLWFEDLDFIEDTISSDPIFRLLRGRQGVDIRPFRNADSINSRLKEVLVPVAKQIARSVQLQGPVQRGVRQERKLSTGGEGNLEDRRSVPKPGGSSSLSSQVLLAGSLVSDASYPRVFEFVGEVAKAIARSGARLVVSGTRQASAIDQLVISGLPSSERAEATVVVGAADLRGGASPAWASDSRIVKTNAREKSDRRAELLLHCDQVVTVGGGFGVADIVDGARDIGLSVLPLPFTGGESRRRWEAMVGTADFTGGTALSWDRIDEPAQLAAEIAGFLLSLSQHQATRGQGRSL